MKLWNSSLILILFYRTVFFAVPLLQYIVVIIPDEEEIGIPVLSYCVGLSTNSQVIKVNSIFLLCLCCIWLSVASANERKFFEAVSFRLILVRFGSLFYSSTSVIVIAKCHKFLKICWYTIYIYFMKPRRGTSWRSVHKTAKDRG